jgi:lipoic acid synthetase
VPVPVNYRFTPEETARQVDHCDARLLFYEEDLAHRVTPALAGLPKVEALVPDFRGKRESLDILLDSFPPDVLCINVEVVKRLYPKVRPAGRYEWALDLLTYAKKKMPTLITKSSLIVGLGETDEEVLETLRDLASCGVDIVTVGLYLMPSKECVRPARIVFEDTFKTYGEWGRKLGIPVVVSGPLVRSSFVAEEAYRMATGGVRDEKGSCDKPQGQEGL